MARLTQKYRQKRVILAGAALEGVCDRPVTQDLCSLAKTGTQPRVRGRGGVRTLKECSSSGLTDRWLNVVLRVFTPGSSWLLHLAHILEIAVSPTRIDTFFRFFVHPSRTSKDSFI